MTDYTIRDGEAASAERLEEIADMLQNSVISPLENLEGMLRKSWTQDEAADVFLSRLDIRLDNLRAVKREILESNDISDGEGSL